MTKTKVLIAEDDPISLRVVETMLKKWGYEPVSAHDGEEALQALQSDDPPRIAILDWMMPRKDGISVCRELRQQTDRAYVYILLLTARSQQRDLVEGLGAGADDYLTKPYSGEELRARLFSGERILEVQQQLVAAREALRVQAIRDPLTGLFNRRYMGEALERELRRAEHGGQPLSMIMLDVDHFKRFNDTSGHQAGDDLLIHIGSLLQARTRREDIACRYGGEEFLLILPGAPLEAALRRAEELRRQIRESTVEHRGQSLGGISVSAGVACFPEHGTSADGLLRAADMTLYRAKELGRDRVEACERPAPMTAPAPLG
ncbi:MAG TPA: diguanylate cyclase [Terriglobia bacterium]|nr:diguanylate cyclase [Terriglobia bacterium]